MDEREIRPGDYMGGHLWRVVRAGAATQHGCPECDSDGQASERHPQADAERREREGSRGAA